MLKLVLQQHKLFSSTNCSNSNYDYSSKYGLCIFQFFPPATFADGSRREYHALTRGFILNEIFRRVDPAGRTVGQFVREELNGKLGADVRLGAPEERERERAAALKAWGMKFTFLHALLPSELLHQIYHL